MLAEEALDSEYALFARDGRTSAQSIDNKVVVDALKKKGAVIFREFFDSMDEFIEFTDRFTKEYVPYVGGANNGRATVGGSKSVYTVTEPSMKMPVPLHGEMYYAQKRPDLLWFYCITPPAANGETTLCDGRRILLNLSPETRRDFETRKISYLRNFAKDVWPGVYQTDQVSGLTEFCNANELDLKVHDDGSITTRHTSSAVVPARGGKAFINSVLTFAAQEYVGGSKESQVRWSNGDEIARASLMEVKTVSDHLTTAHPWRSGDLIMIDNTRVMHGRRAFKDDQRNIVVRLGMLAH